MTKKQTKWYDTNDIRFWIVLGIGVAFVFLLLININDTISNRDDYVKENSGLNYVEYNNYVEKKNKATVCNQEYNDLVDKSNNVLGQLKETTFSSTNYKQLKDKYDDYQLELNTKSRSCQELWLGAKLFFTENRDTIEPVLSSKDYYEELSYLEMRMNFHQEARAS